MPLAPGEKEGGRGALRTEPAMTAPSIMNRVEVLERRVTPIALLPGQIANLTSIVANLALQVSQLRDELRVAISASGDLERDHDRSCVLGVVQPRPSER